MEDLPDPFGPATTIKRLLLVIRIKLDPVLGTVLQILVGHRIEDAPIVEFATRADFLDTFLVSLAGG